jgi:MFS family permease
MTTTIPVPLDETAVSDASDVQAAVATSATKLTKPLRRTAIGISALLTSLVAINSGGMGVLIPDLVSKLDAANKVTNLAIVATVAFVVTIIAQPLAGALSDATRSRFGRRSPWIVFGALVAGGFTIGLPLAASSLAMITVTWVLVQVGVNAVLAAAQAIVPDRFAPSQRGAASSLAGVGVTLGNAVGAGIAGGLAMQGRLPYAVLGLLLLVVAGVFVLVNREASNVDLPRAAFSWKAFAKGFWVSPRKHPDFAWAFAARFLMVIGFAAGTTYGLYTLRDYIGLDEATSNVVVAQMAVILLLGTFISAAVSGKLSDKSGRRKPFIVWASVIMAASFVLPLAWPTVTSMLVYSFVMGLGFGTYIAIDLALMTEVLPVPVTGSEDSAGRDLAILGIATTIPQAITPGLAGALITIFGGYQVTFIAGIVFVLLGIVAIIPIRSVR